MVVLAVVVVLSPNMTWLMLKDSSSTLVPDKIFSSLVVSNT